MRIASLGSGSRGNGTLIDDGRTCVLVDLGFTLKETQRRLKRLGKAPHQVDAVLVTHEHADHIHGVALFARKYKCPVYLTPGTYDANRMGALPQLRRINCHKPFHIDSLGIVPVPVPHDAKEPCQYIISSDGIRIGVLTDLGHVTPFIEEQYAKCNALLLECNHDTQMLADGPYPYPLKQRVGGNHGHLNNDQAAELLGKIQLSTLQHLVISHVSEKNNAPDLAYETVTSALGDWEGSLKVADQESGFDWIDL